jgi:glycosyltransferase involved in cell wall biosynthesis
MSLRASKTKAPEKPEAGGKLKILVISLFHPELVRGGAQQIAYELFQGLQARDDVAPVLLASVDQQFPALFKLGARITGFDQRPDEFLFLTRDYDYWWHKIGSPLLLEGFAEFLEEIAPDVVHVHHFMTLGIDLLSLIRVKLPKARIVFTFHEFMAICAADGHMVRRTDKSQCTKSSQIRCYQCIPERTPEQFLMRKLWMTHHLDKADAYTVPGRFMAERFADWGLAAEKIHFVTNGQSDYAGGIKPPPASTRRNRFGFFGQFVDVKGVHILLRAADLLRAEGFDDFTIELNGDNLRYATEPVRAEVEAFLAAEAERPLAERRVVNNGSYHVEQLAARMARVDWCVMPSMWAESFGLVMSEAWMFGRPVISADAGGMAERNPHDRHGLQFALGDHRALADAIRRAASEDGLWDKFSQALPAPPSRDEMVEGYMRVYRGG